MFSTPAIGADGTAGRNIIDGPGIRNVDLGLFRDVRLIGQTRLQLRLEATNVFNIVNLMNPARHSMRRRLGKIRSARDMRTIQLGARVWLLQLHVCGTPPRGAPWRVA